MITNLTTRLSILSSVAAFFASHTLAAEEAAKVYELEPSSLVATRFALPLSELSLSTSYVDAEQLERQQFRSVADVLASLPGTIVVRNGQSGSVASLFTRGTESNHTAFLLNGRRLPAGFSGQYDLGLLGVDNIETIEFVRGPSSSLYGADAIGGVVDLRSKEADPGFSGTLQSEIGAFDTRLVQSQLGYGVEDFSTSFDLSYEETDNDRPGSDFDRISFNSYSTYELSDKLDFDLQALFYEAYLEVAGDNRFAPFPSGELNETTAYLISPRLKLELTEEFALELFYSHTRNELEATETPFLSNARFTETGNEVEALARFNPEEKPYEFAFGFRFYEVDFHREPIQPTFTPEFKERYHSLSTFGQGIWDVTDQLRLIGSGRFDDYSDFDDAATGNLELSYRIKETGTVLFAKYGTGYAAPVGNDLARLNEELKPEESRSWEIGLNQKLVDGKLNWALIYFQTDIENLVDNDPGFTRYQVVDTEQEGVETIFTFQPIDILKLEAAYTYLDAVITDGLYFGGFAGTPGDRLIRRPRHKISFNAEVGLWERGHLGLGVVSELDREDPANTKHEDRTLVRIYSDWELFDNFTIFARVENLFDEEYEYTPGFEGAGRAAYVGARYSF